MKKAIFFFAFLVIAGFASAQSCGASSAGAGKSCCASKVAKAAAADPSIEKRMDDQGMVSYVRKETDTQGNVKFVSVQFDEAQNTFVNIAPKSATASSEAKAEMVKKSASCTSEKSASGCCSSKAASGSKSCCAKPAEKVSQ